MEEAEKQDSVPEVISPEAEIQQEEVQSTPVAKEAPAEDADWIKNLRRGHKEALRQLEEERRERKVERELLQKLVSQSSGPQQVQNPVEENILDDLAKQEYVEGPKVAKALQKQREDFRKEIDEVKKTYAAQQQNSLISELKREFPDFDQVVNPETLAELEEKNPRLATAIARSNDPYLMAIQSYEYIKAKSLSSKPAESKRAKETEAKIEQNKKIVQSPQAYDKRPMAAAFQMTKDMEKELQKEMMTYARQVGMGY